LYGRLGGPQGRSGRFGEKDLRLEEEEKKTPKDAVVTYSKVCLAFLGIK
jgi:hypothetical protein